MKMTLKDRVLARGVLLKDVAKELGIAPNTFTNSLNNGGLSKKNREKLEDWLNKNDVRAVRK